MEWRRWRACNHVRRFQLRRMGDQRWGGGDGKGEFNGDKAKSEKLVQMKGKDAWEIGRYIDAQTWSIMPGAEKSESGVADACAKQLAKTS